MKDHKKWFAVRVLTTPVGTEAVEVAFNSLGSIGTEINNLGKKRIDGKIRVIGYFEEEPALGVVDAELANSLELYDLCRAEIEAVSIDELQDQDWLAEWKKHWTPTETDRFIISPPWINPENDEKIIIRIEPKMAFGTGTHETTRLCLQAIESHFHPGMSFLDVGTGTGILSIAAAKLSADDQSRIIGFDTDRESVEAAKENADINAVPNIEFYDRSISDVTPEFDFVCANMTIDIIEPMIPILLDKAARILVLSGILETQKDEIIGALSACGVENPKVERNGEWISVLIEKQH